ncbi:MAG: helix-turn-helix transcriptional regulator [Eubacteriales bacterium]|nr:helix-turn-helix transcriptional regulator [Eubacteriales bacterium]
MILADKIIDLRKKNGWSQEELAEKLNVTRQSISKWEGAQSTPDLNKILAMSQLFGVSTDYLLKDEQGEVEYIATEEQSAVRKVSMEEANAYLNVTKRVSKWIALGVALCIASPICLILLAGQADAGHISEGFAVGIGMLVLLVMVAAAVALFISSGMKRKPYEYLESEIIETAYGVSGMLREKQESYRSTYVRRLVLGICLCILSVVPLMMAAMMHYTSANMMAIIGVGVLLFVVAIGVFLIILAAMPWSAMQKLLEEGDYARQNKGEKGKRNSAISSAYWLTAVAVFLCWSFVTNAWDRTWIVWPIAGVLYPALMGILGAFKKEN